MRRPLAAAAVVCLAAACSDTGAQPAGDAGPDAATLGAPGAPILVVEYHSSTCGHCARFDAELFPYIREKWIDTGQAQWVMRVLPTSPVELSVAGSLLARCAGPDRYFAVLHDLFATQEALFAAANVNGAIAYYEEIGRQYGLGADAVGSCLADEAGIASINASIDAARAEGVNGTPTFIINGEDRGYVGDLDTAAEWDSAMDAALARGRPAQ